MKVWGLLLVVLAMSWLLTLLLRRYALVKSIMDIPNERSSHSIPTPRGGGVAIVASFLLALPVLNGLELLTSSLLWGLLGAGSLVAVIGFADDHGHIAARWRLLGHFLAGGWLLFWSDGFPPTDLFGVIFDLGWLGDILGVLFLVWMLNLYNFMDGIDGLASAEAISVCVGMCLVFWVSGYTELIFAPLILVAAVAGFLFWNFPPARIFMGDAGSGFLGLIFGALVIRAAWIKPDLFWSSLILLGVFVVDATWTLARRLLRAQKIYQAHRSHAYQHASRLLGNHKTVTLGVVALNVCWLLPLALLVGCGRLDGILGLAVAYAPLVFLSIKLDAGKE
jgi:Fuc2NAc and GlcNAc transferase